MKKILILLVSFLILSSCSSEVETQETTIELVPVVSVEMPDNFITGEENQIIVRYNRPTNCHGFDGFYYEKDGNTRTVAVQNYFYNNGNCQNLTNDLKEEIMKFYPPNTGSFTFKFWQGKDSNGNDIYLEIVREAILL